MSIYRAKIGEILEADINQVVEDGFHEGLTLEFKRDMYGNSDADKKEFLKDLSSLANSSGGHLLIGIEEDQGIARAKTPIAGDADATLQRLEQIARAGLEPRIIDLGMHAVPIASGGYIYVIRAPKSWNPPHRVSFQNSNRFYLRSSAGAHEASVEELRAVFANSADIQSRIATFVRDRERRISDNEGVLPLARGAGTEGTLLLHIIPFSAFSGIGQIDVQTALDTADLLQPLGSTGNSRINFEGFMTVRTAEVPHGYTQLFRNGIIEATKVRLVAPRERIARIPIRSFIEPIYQRLPRYFRAMQALGVPAPFGISISLIEVEGAILGIGNEWQDEQYPINRPNLLLPMQVVSSFGTDASYRGAITPAIHALWNSVGLPSAEQFLANYNPDGVWIGR